MNDLPQALPRRPERHVDRTRRRRRRNLEAPPFPWAKVVVVVLVVEAMIWGVSFTLRTAGLLWLLDR